MTIYLTRNKGWVWERPWPNWKLVVPCEATQLLGTLIVVYGIAMAPIGWWLALFVWAYTLVSFFVANTVKVGTYLYARAPPAFACAPSRPHRGSCCGVTEQGSYSRRLERSMKIRMPIINPEVGAPRSGPSACRRARSGGIRYDGEDARIRRVEKTKSSGCPGRQVATDLLTIILVKRAGDAGGPRPLLPPAQTTPTLDLDQFATIEILIIFLIVTVSKVPNLRSLIQEAPASPPGLPFLCIFSAKRQWTIHFTISTIGPPRTVDIHRYALCQSCRFTASRNT